MNFLGVFCAPSTAITVQTKAKASRNMWQRARFGVPSGFRRSAILKSLR
jgi:hypothetical protein